MTCLLALLLSSPADAGGLAAGVFGTFDAPLQADSSSSAGPGFAGFVGYELPVPKVHVRPELQGRLVTAAEAFTLAAGATATVGGNARFGGAAHVGVPLTGGSGPLPMFDIGPVFEVKVTKLLLTATTAYSFIPTTQYKCGTCEQPSQQWLLSGLSVGFLL
ncbi:MAG: hypothetical protein H0V89_01865 [Deltaproteobacteria bacterium]|nr:hypothetical protein [Deltaproteobacteria bacterium]